MDISDEVKQIEKELVDIIVMKLKERKMDVPTAQVMAADFLDLLPIEDQKALLAKLKEFGQKHTEAQGLYVEELTKTSDKKDNEALGNMRDAIASGDIEQAISHAKSLQANM